MIVSDEMNDMAMTATYITRGQQRPLLLQHQGTRRHYGHDFEALMNEWNQHRCDSLCSVIDVLDEALLQLWHSAAFGVDHIDVYAVMRQHSASGWMVRNKSVVTIVELTPAYSQHVPKPISGLLSNDARVSEGEEDRRCEL